MRACEARVVESRPLWQEIGFGGCLVSLWRELDPDGGGHISLHDIDAAAALQLSEFKASRAGPTRAAVPGLIAEAVPRQCRELHEERAGPGKHAPTAGIWGSETEAFRIAMPLPLTT